MRTLLLAASLLATSAHAANPTTCNYPDVQAAVAMSQQGDTVNIPAGYCNWGANELAVRAGIHLKGAGRTATVIRRTAPVSSAKITYLIRFECFNGLRVRFSDMTLVGTNSPGSPDRGLGLTGGCVDFVVANAKFTKFMYSAVEVRGGANQRGVIHSSQFIDNYSAPVHNYGYGVAIYGTHTWPALDLGSQNAVFLEDNYMAGNRHHVAANAGARYVFRHNTAVANDLTRDFPQVDAHGLTSTDEGAHGTRSWEVYGNNFLATLTQGRNLAGVGMRGGSGVVFDNMYSANIAYPVLLVLEGKPCGTYPVADQVRDAYITDPVASQCPRSIESGRDYFQAARPGYQPYTYPHPLRTPSL